MISTYAYFPVAFIFHIIASFSQYCRTSLNENCKRDYMIVTTVFLVLYIVPEFYLFLKIVKPALEHKIVHEPAVGGGAIEKKAGAIGGGAGT